MTDRDLICLVRDTYGVGILQADRIVQRACRNAKVPTKRELYAAMALQGLLSNITKISGEWIGQLTPQFMARQAVKAADCLIEELAKDQSDDSLKEP